MGPAHRHDKRRASPEGCLKLNTDAAASLDADFVGIGGVLRDHRDKGFAGFSLKFPTKWLKLGLAIRGRLSYVKQLGYRLSLAVL